MVTSKTQRIAIIDLGSNTARLVVMTAIPGYAYRLEDEIREVVRLREGMTAAGLSEKSEARALSTLRLFKRFCDGSNVDLIIPTATSAVREAPNGKRFVEHVRRDIGLSLQILDGDREAYYAALGALNEVPAENGFMVDIGGGSAQIARIESRRFQSGCSLPLGALALTERFVEGDPISPKEYEAVQQEIDKQLDSVAWLQEIQKGNPSQILIGLGGTIRNLGKMDSVRNQYPLNTLHGFCLSRMSVEESVKQLRELPLKKRRRLPGLNSDRADIILPGAMVILTIMKRLKMDGLIISINGLREGLFLEHFWDHLSYPVVDDVRRFSVLNMARIYNYQKAHASHVRFLAFRLFNQLRPLHDYGAAERELLDAAALLHDLGSIISYYDHHKHSETLIINSGLPGFTPREVSLIALLARYHRKGKPKLGRFSQLLQKSDKVLLERLSAILRLAEFLERGRNATVDDVIVAWDKRTLRLTLVADDYPAVELWEAERNAVKLMAKAYQRKVVLESTAAPDDWDKNGGR